MFEIDKLHDFRQRVFYRRAFEKANYGNKEIMNKKDKDRSNATGKYVTETFADENPDETTSEVVKTDPLKKWFKRLRKDGGKIIAGSGAQQQGEAFEAYGDTFVYIGEEDAPDVERKPEN